MQIDCPYCDSRFRASASIGEEVTCPRCSCVFPAVSTPIAQPKRRISFSLASACVVILVLVTVLLTTRRSQPVSTTSAQPLNQSVPTSSLIPERQVARRMRNQSDADRDKKAESIIAAASSDFRSNGYPEESRNTAQQVYESAVASCVVVATSNGHGSGVCVVIDDNKYILTSRHVVEHEKDLDEILVASEVVDWTSPVSFIWSESVDYALLEMPRRYSVPAIQVSVVGPAVGSSVLAIGTPGIPGHGEIIPFRLSKGIVSGWLELEGARFFETGASMNRGMSGGPVLNYQAEVVGIVTWGVNSEQYNEGNMATPCSEILSSYQAGDYLSHDESFSRVKLTTALAKAFVENDRRLVENHRKTQEDLDKLREVGQHAVAIADISLEVGNTLSRELYDLPTGSTEANEYVRTVRAWLGTSGEFQRAQKLRYRAQKLLREVKAADRIKDKYVRDRTDQLTTAIALSAYALNPSSTWSRKTFSKLVDDYNAVIHRMNESW